MVGARKWSLHTVKFYQHNKISRFATVHFDDTWPSIDYTSPDGRDQRVYFETIECIRARAYVLLRSTFLTYPPDLPSAFHEQDWKITK